tara:strand:- start:6 stop:1160 length:1155 start_codon:yes stop_codon:yes gene_type:complete
VNTLESYLLEKSNKRGNKNLNILHSFFSKNDLKILKNNTISLVGTNGKSSTAFNLHNLLTSLKIKSLVFTSPHLVDFKERISAEENIQYDDFLESVQLFERDNNLNLGYFEVMFLIACQIFLKNDLDYFICEAGIGGLYDTTSVIQSKKVVLTSISYDHTELLGNKLEDILRQKLYISNNIDLLFIGDIQKDLINNIHRNYNHIILTNNIRDYLHEKNIDIENITSREKNQYLAIMALDVLLEEKSFDDLISIKLPNNPGRFEIIQNEPLKIIDGAHNIEGVERLLSDFGQLNDSLFVDLFIGFKKGKDYIDILNLIKGHKPNSINLIQDNTFFEQETVAKIASHLEKIEQKYQVVHIDKFMENKNPCILLGSLYLIGEFKKDI